MNTMTTAADPATAPQEPDTAYDRIADSRPRLRRDVLFTETPDGVLFHNAKGGFSLNSRAAYRFATLVVPHLDGAATVAALTRGLGPTQRAMLVRLVSTLYEHGFARDATPTSAPEQEPPAPEVAARFAAQIAYVDHYADHGADRFQRFRTTPVAVLGDDPLARSCALGLISNGCADVAVTDGPGLSDLLDEARELTEAGCPVTVTRLNGPAEPEWAELDRYRTVVAGGTGRIARLLAQGVPAGRTLLPAWAFGRSAVIGPLTTEGADCCWGCAVLRLGTNGSAEDAAEVWRAVATDGPWASEPAPWTGPVTAMLGNLLGFEVFRLATGALPAETAGRVIVQELDSLDVVSERLLAHPRCPYCSPTTPAVPLPIGAVDGPAPESHAHDATASEPAGEEAKQAALAELTAREELVGARAGVFVSFADDHWNQSPLKVGTVGVGVGDGRRRLISAFDLHHVAAARLRALLRAAEVYVARVVPVDTAAPDASWPAVPPRHLSTGSGTDVHPDAITAWAPAVSLLDGRTVRVPVAALRTFGPHNRERLCEATAAGLGAGSDPAGAVRRGLLTALAHDELRKALRRTTPVARVAPEDFTDDAELTFLARTAERLEVTMELLELGEPALRPVPVVLARCADPLTGAWQWAVGAAPRRRDAALEAVRDLLGRLQLSAEAGVDTGDPLFDDLDVGALSATATPGADADTPSWACVLERLRAAGRDVLVAPVDAPDLRAGGISAARVLLTDGCRGDDH
ncbi:TOMM precursor leader peptide-binding protein [Kitasatospora sp. NPDC004669]|uniref:TOMM precursor leader peptide-binding protein n=1 Tax=Kitasatospora sp. NPDC004669 TaxID=3154555 RepID=UPI0033B64CDD